MARLHASIVVVTPFQQNCAILWDEASGRGVVVDPGGEAPRIHAEVQRLGVAVERILLTHGHLDHAGGAAELRRLLAAPERPVPIEGPDARDRFLLEGIDAQAAAFGIADMHAVEPDRWLSEGETVAIADVPFEVRHCPGHTPGHVVFINREGRFAILGDVLFQGSVGRTDFPYGDEAVLLAAIETKLLPLGDDVQFLCGHGPGSTIGAERRSNPFLRR